MLVPGIMPAVGLLFTCLNGIYEPAPCRLALILGFVLGPALPALSATKLALYFPECAIWDQHCGPLRLAAVAGPPLIIGGAAMTCALRLVIGGGTERLSP